MSFFSKKKNVFILSKDIQQNLWTENMPVVAGRLVVILFYMSFIVSWKFLGKKGVFVSQDKRQSRKPTRDAPPVAQNRGTSMPFQDDVVAKVSYPFTKNFKIFSQILSISHKCSKFINI